MYIMKLFNDEINNNGKGCFFFAKDCKYTETEHLRYILCRYNKLLSDLYIGEVN